MVGRYVRYVRKDGTESVGYVEWVDDGWYHVEDCETGEVCDVREVNEY